MILKIFLPKNFTKIGVSLLKLMLAFEKNVNMALVFEINAIFSAENWQKPQKIVILTSTPGANPASLAFATTTLVGSRPERFLRRIFFLQNALTYLECCKFLIR
jgi:hypothetical protein